MTRILFLCSTLGVGGRERQLALLLPELQKHGFDPFIATLRHRGPNFEALQHQGVATCFLRLRSRADVAGIARTYRLWRLRPDIVFTSSVDAQVIGHLVAARARAPHVTVEHGGAGLPRALHRRLLVRLIAPRVERVVAVSSSQLDPLRGLGYRSDRITVIPNGIPAPSPTHSRAAVRADLGIGEDDVIALLVATLRPEKRAAFFIEALRRAHMDEPRLRGVIVGGGPELERVRKLEAGTPDLVRVLGERTDVPDLIAASDVVCLTSAFEGLPITVLEAMALSRPLVATKVGGIPDAVADGHTGTLVAPQDVEAFAEALVSLAKDPGLRRTMGDAARGAYLDRFTLEAMVEGYVQLFRPMADRHQPQRDALPIGSSRENP